MDSTSHCSPQTPAESAALRAPQLVDLVGKLEREVVNLRRQVAWFQRQIFGQKSEKRLPAPDPLQGRLGIGFDPVPGSALPAKKTVVAGHVRKTKQPVSGADESTLVFDERRYPLKSLPCPIPPPRDWRQTSTK